MNNFEKNSLGILLNEYMQNYIEDLADENKVNFNVKVEMNEQNIPFRVYNAVYERLLNQLSMDSNADYLLTTILRDTYLYSFFKNDQNTGIILSLLKKNDIEFIAAEISDDTLLGTAIIKSFCNYLVLINEDETYKTVLEEEAIKNDGKEILDKFSVPSEIITTRNDYMRNMLMDFIYELECDNYSQNEIYEELDEYFDEGKMSASLFHKYSFLFNDDPKEFEKFLTEQIRLVFETIYISLIKGNCSLETDDFDLLSYIEDDDEYLDFPEEQEIRWELYTIFINQSQWFDLKNDIKSLSQKDHKVLRKIYPNYILDAIH